jgi:hypothetical protein
MKIARLSDAVQSIRTLRRNEVFPVAAALLPTTGSWC